MQIRIEIKFSSWILPPKNSPGGTSPWHVTAERLRSPLELQRSFPLPFPLKLFVNTSRAEAAAILHGQAMGGEASYCEWEDGNTQHGDGLDTL